MTPNTIAATTPATAAAAPTTPQANASTLRPYADQGQATTRTGGHSSRPEDRRANNVPLTPVNSGTQQSLTDDRSPSSAMSVQVDTAICKQGVSRVIGSHVQLRA